MWIDQSNQSFRTINVYSVNEALTTLWYMYSVCGGWYVLSVLDHRLVIVQTYKSPRKMTIQEKQKLFDLIEGLYVVHWSYSPLGIKQNIFIRRKRNWCRSNRQLKGWTIVSETKAYNMVKKLYSYLKLHCKMYNFTLIIYHFFLVSLS